MDRCTFCKSQILEEDLGVCRKCRDLQRRHAHQVAIEAAEDIDDRARAEAKKIESEATEKAQAIVSQATERAKEIQRGTNARRRKDDIDFDDENVQIAFVLGEWNAKHGL